MPIDKQTFHLPERLAGAVRGVLDQWRAGDKVRRLWARDAGLWTGRDEADWLGWLDVPDRQLAAIESLQAFAREVRASGFSDALLLGMGGSSLCAEVLRATFGEAEGFPRLQVLDSTDPARIRRVEANLKLDRTLVIVSSKSGTTLEPNILMEYFFERVSSMLGMDAARHFVAVTDPGSGLEEVAWKRGYRRVFHGEPGIGGRFSALSDFGMVPASVMGLDLQEFLRRAQGMVRICGVDVPAADNPGIALGVSLGVLAERGCDKVTLVASPGLSALGAWLEQLLAESTGKGGLGLIPIDGEDLMDPDRYGDDRVFVGLKLETDGNDRQEAVLKRLEKAGHPVVRISIACRYDLGAEFFRWEIATAVAGSVLGINPFDQPDVEANKTETRRLAAIYEATGRFPSQEPIADVEGMALFADASNAESLLSAAGGRAEVAPIVGAHLARLDPGDYFAVLAYVEDDASSRERLREIRHAVGGARKVATSVNFGPRYLHATGQAFKGGPNTGVFLQITHDDAADLPVPGRGYSFGAIKAAQAQGDLEVLGRRGRRALRVHLGRDVAGGLTRLQEIIASSLRR